MKLEQLVEEQVKTIQARSLGPTTPLSIGTAMIFDNDDFDVKQWEPFLYANIQTLYRNFSEAIGREAMMTMSLEAFLPKFMEELDTFEEYVGKYTNSKTEVVFYLPDYKDIQRFLPQALLRSIKTQAQKVLFDFEMSVYKEMRKEKKERKKEAGKDWVEPFLEVEYELPRGKGPSLIFTHIPSDLLSYARFPLLKLIESHTGKIKPRSEWWTKLTGDKERLSHIPFNKFTLQICGDGNHLIASGTKKMKDFLFDLAQQNNWTSLTTPDRIRFCINLMKDKATRDLLLKWT